MNIGVIVAMDMELQQLLRFIPQPSETSLRGQKFWTGSFGEDRVVVTKCGIGKVNAAFGTLNLIDGFAPDAVVSTGCAGGASAGLEIRDVVVSERTCYHDVWCGQPNVPGQVQDMPAVFNGDVELLSAVVGSGEEHRVRSGLIVTGDWFVDSVEKMNSITSVFPDALAVDMESAAIAQVCYRLGRRFVSFRVISDIPAKPGNLAAYKNFWSEVADQSFGITKDVIMNILNK